MLIPSTQHLVLHFGFGAFVIWVPGKAWSLQKIRIFPQKTSQKRLNFSQMCLIFGGAHSFSFPVTISWWKILLTLIFVPLQNQGTSHNFLHFLMGWSRGSSPGGITTSLGEMSFLTKMRNCKKKFTFGGPRKIFWGAFWVGPNQNSEPQGGQDGVF